MQKSLSVIMPAYNEQGAIAQAVEDVRQFVFPAAPISTLIVIDDGSKDRTGEILDQLQAADPRIKVIHKINGGHGSALLAGLQIADTDYCFILDSDRQIALDNFPDYWQTAQKCDAVFGVRSQRHDPKFRLMLTRIIRWVIRLTFFVNIQDSNVPFKIFKRSLWQRARPLIPDGTLAPSMFFALYAAKNKADIAYIDVPHIQRRTGVVSIRRWKLIKFCAKGLRQLIAFRLRLR